MQSEAKTTSQFQALLRSPDRKRKTWGKDKKKPSLNLQVPEKAAQAAPGKAGQAVGGRGGGGRDGGRGAGRGGRGGGRFAGRGDEARKPKFQIHGDAAAAFVHNGRISNLQAQFLTDNGRCWHCTLPYAECKQDRPVSYKKCKLEGKGLAATSARVPGIPDWK